MIGCRPFPDRDPAPSLLLPAILGSVLRFHRKSSVSISCARQRTSNAIHIKLLFFQNVLLLHTPKPQPFCYLQQPLVIAGILFFSGVRLFSRRGRFLMGEELRSNTVCCERRATVLLDARASVGRAFTCIVSECDDARPSLDVCPLSGRGPFRYTQPAVRKCAPCEDGAEVHHCPTAWFDTVPSVPGVTLLSQGGR